MSSGCYETNLIADHIKAGMSCFYYLHNLKHLKSDGCICTFLSRAMFYPHCAPQFCCCCAVWLQNPLPYFARFPEADILVSSDATAPTHDDEGLEDPQVIGRHDLNIGEL